MRIAIRCDASGDTGTGHLGRCLTLADELTRHGGHSCFLTNDHPLSRNLLAGSGHDVHFLAAAECGDWARDAQACRAALATRAVDWLVVDHYGLDARWEAAARDLGNGLLVIDDLADRPHQGDVVVDAGFTRVEADYLPWVAAESLVMTGTRFALLKHHFGGLHGAAPRWPSVRRVHVFLGGGDAAKWLPGCCEAVLQADAGLSVAAVGTAEPGAMHALGERFPGQLEWSRHVDDMAAHMSRCDIAVGSPGTATWERACIGLPSALISTADNQVPILQALEGHGFCRYLGRIARLGSTGFADDLVAFLSDRAALDAFRAVGEQAVDGLGAGRILACMTDAGHSSRAVMQHG